MQSFEELLSKLHTRTDLYDNSLLYLDLSLEEYKELVKDRFEVIKETESVYGQRGYFCESHVGRVVLYIWEGCDEKFSAKINDKFGFTPRTESDLHFGHDENDELDYGARYRNELEFIMRQIIGNRINAFYSESTWYSMKNAAVNLASKKTKDD